MEFVPNHSRMLSCWTLLFHVHIFTASDDIQVTVNIIDRSVTDPIFSNEPFPLWTTCPVWIRPRTVIYTVRSIDKDVYNADVRYRLESGEFYSYVTW